MTPPPVYQLNDVQQCYTQRCILDIPSLTIEQGEIFALVGPSGAGKSTLLRLLAFLESPSGGEITLQLDDQPSNNKTITIEERRKLAMVFQRPALLSRNVYANVAYGLQLRDKNILTEQVNSILERVSLGHLAKAGADTLSGGEMQRVAVARALILNPQVLILDEPTANLDPANVRLIEELITEQHHKSNTTIILVTHNIFQARRLATRVGFLLDGQLVETTPTEEFFTTPVDPRTVAFLSGDLIY